MSRLQPTLLLIALFVFAVSPVTVKAQSGDNSSTITSSETPRNALVAELDIEIQQITFVDQRSENFGAVAEIRMKWKDDALKFDSSEFGSEYKIFDIDEFNKFARGIPTITPDFSIQNQQGKRWIQTQKIVVHSNGIIEYFELSSVKLQAPYFDFKKYPFDTQKFYYEIVSTHPIDEVQFVASENVSGLGPLLGEEEWIFEDPKLVVSTAPGITGLESSEAALGFTGRRHIEYYIMRIFVPLIIIIIVSWACFFVGDYQKRIDIAGANFLVFVAFNFAISGNLPKLGYVTFLDFILMAMFVITGSLILACVALQRLAEAGRETLARRIDNLIIALIYPLGYAAVIAFATYAFLMN